MSIFDRFSHPEIDPDDLRSAINARIQHGVADSKRAVRGMRAAQEVEQDLFVALLARNSIKDWPDWLFKYVTDYAASVSDGAQFFIQLGKALAKGGRSRWFDPLDMFILTNYRKGHNLRSKTRGKAVKILRPLFKLEPLHNPLAKAKEFYASRIKRLGLKSQGAAS